MKIRDSIGNELREGSLVYWKGLQAVCQIAQISEPEEKNGKGPKMGELVLLVKMPFQISEPESFLRDFVAAVNPKDQETVGELMKSKAATQ